MTTSTCWFHGPERVPWNVYRVCFECGHVWTRWRMVAAMWRMGRDFGHVWPVRRPSRTYSCPRCAHDW